MTTRTGFWMETTVAYSPVGDIVGATNIQGNGGLASNQHEFEDPVEMPNLSDLSQYETEALTAGSSISIGGTPMTNAVFGDEGGETGNLYLIGTAADPIVLDGPVVVQGDVIISGHVTGQGAIYAGRKRLRSGLDRICRRADNHAPHGQHASRDRGLAVGQLGQGFPGPLFGGERRRRRPHTFSMAFVRE